MGDLNMKKEIEVVGTRGGRKTRRTRASEENLVPHDDKENISKEEKIDIPITHEPPMENLQKKEENEEKEDSSVLATSKETLEESNKVEEKKSEEIPRGRQMGRRSRPLRRKENHQDTSSNLENDD